MKKTFFYTMFITASISITTVMAQKTPVTDVMQKEIMKEGVDAAIKMYAELKKSQPDEYDFSENLLTNLGIGIYGMGRTMDAKKLLKLNLESYPKSSNIYYYLGLIEYRQNSNSEALIYLKKSLSFNSKNESARDLIQAIESPDLYAENSYVCPPCGCLQDNLKFKNGGTCIQCGMDFVKSGDH